MFVAIARQVSPALENCELTYLHRQPIDIQLARQQHQVYIESLKIMECDVHIMPVELDLPDSVFVEDIAVVLDELAIITRPGAISRRPEAVQVATALQNYRRLSIIQAPGTIDGGDVLCVGKKVYVGISSRSNLHALSQMQAILSPYGYIVTGVAVSGCLHLKSAVTLLAQDTLLMNPAWLDADIFRDMQIITVDPIEPYGANALWIGKGVIYPSSFPRTQQRIENFLEKRGVRLVVVNVSELQKAEGAVTCCSLIFRSKEV